jgi:hypothetical protein
MKKTCFLVLTMVLLASAMSKPSDAEAKGEERTPYDVVSIIINENLYKVVHAPSGSFAGYVSNDKDAVTLFGLAAEEQSIGLLAHRYLAGEYFDKINIGQKIIVVYKNGDIDIFIVDKILSYQALTPTSPSSDFVQVDKQLDPIDNSLISAAELFAKIYTKSDLVLQTCIEKQGNTFWGRLFVKATLFDELPATNKTR